MTVEPILMRKTTAMAYVDMTAAAFERQVASGILPQPVMLDNKQFWHRKQIDRALGVIAGEVEPDWGDIGLYENTAR